MPAAAKVVARLFNVSRSCENSVTGTLYRFASARNSCQLVLSAAYINGFLSETSFNPASSTFASNEHKISGISVSSATCFTHLANVSASLDTERTAIASKVKNSPT